MSSNLNQLDSDVALSRCPDIITNQPHPGEWVLVKQLNMEMREPCEIWRSGVHNQIKKMQCQLTMMCRELQKLDKEIHQNQKLHPIASNEEEDNNDDTDDTEHTDDHKQNNE